MTNVASSDALSRARSFGEALEHIKGGARVAREGWNGKGMWLELVYATLPKHLDYIQMRTAQGDFVPWLASQTDMLANDWVLL